MAELTKDEIISWFENEIKQYEIMLGGFLNKEYRTHIEKKVLCYQSAIAALEKGEEL